MMISASIIWWILTSARKLLTNRKFIPKTAITNEMKPIKTRIEQIKAQAGWILKAPRILPCANVSIAVV